MHKWTLDAEATEEIVAHALDLGINFFDTANCYSEGTSEAYLGRALKAHTDQDIAALEEFYVPHPIVGAINQNPPQGVVMLDAKK